MTTNTENTEVVANEEVAEVAETPVDVVNTETPAEEPAPVEPTPAEEPAEVVTDTVQQPVVEPSSIGTNPAPAPVTPAPAVDFRERLKQTEAKAAAKAAPNKAPETSSTPDAPRTFEDIIDDLKRIGNQAQKNTIATLEKYSVDMAPGKVVGGDEGAKIQYLFWRALQSIAEETSADDFRKAWSIILMYFHNKSEGVFNARYVFRFSESWTWSDTDLEAFHNLLNLLSLTANPATRQSVIGTSVSLDKVLAKGFTDRARQNITSFYR